MKAIILAAGRGERLRPLTNKLPKPMLPINKKPNIEYLILLLKKYGIEEIGINTSYLPNKIKNYLGDGKKWGVNIKFSFEKELLGTSGALNNFKEFLNESFFVIYGDNLTDMNLEKMIDHHKRKKSIATIALRKKPKEYKTQSLVIADKKLKLKEFIEKPSEEQVKLNSGKEKLINSGIYLFQPEVLKYIPNGFSDFGYNIIPKLIENERVYGYIMEDCYYMEIGKIEKYQSAKKEIESKRIKLKLENNAIFLDRDGVINEHIYETDGKLMSPANLDQLKILPLVKKGIEKMKKMGFKVVIISNQPGVAFGYINKEKLKEIDDYLKENLKIDGIYYCIHHEKITGPCNCKKPKIGLIKKAAERLNLDIKESFMVGDSLSDIKTGQNAKVKKTFLIGIIREDILNIQHQKNIFPDFTCKNLVEVANKIKEINELDSI